MAEVHPAGPRGLRSLSLDLTWGCNLSCGYCYLRPRSGGIMPVRIARRAIDLLLASPLRRNTLLLTGGEPFLTFPLVRQVVLHARRNCPPGKRLRITVNTNGTLLTPEIVSFLAEQEVEAQISFDGVAEAQSLRHPGSFERLDRLLTEVRREEPRYFRRFLSIAMTVGPDTIPFLAASVRYFLSKRVRDLRVGVTFLGRREACPGPADLLDLLDAQFTRIVDDCVRHFRATGESPVAMLRSPVEEPDLSGTPLCHAATGECLAVGPSGQTSICPVFLSGAFPESGRLSRLRTGLLLGPLAARGFRDRLASVALAAARIGIFRREHKRSALGECSTCEAASFCRPCPASMLLEADNEDPDRIPDLQCAFFRVAARHRRRYLQQRGNRFSEGFAHLLRAVGTGGRGFWSSPVRNPLIYLRTTNRPVAVAPPVSTRQK
jgi:sulfatase maturation enzyme AslB (radical SAM superfamily)